MLEKIFDENLNETKNCNVVFVSGNFSVREPYYFWSKTVDEIVLTFLVAQTFPAKLPAGFLLPMSRSTFSNFHEGNQHLTLGFYSIHRNADGLKTTKTVIESDNYLLFSKSHYLKHNWLDISMMASIDSFLFVQ